jgi:hypothetical protein
MLAMPMRKPAEEDSHREGRAAWADSFATVEVATGVLGIKWYNEYEPTPISEVEPPYEHEMFTLT